MDNQRFDRLSRHVGQQASRRGAIKAAAGGTLALLGLGAISRKAAASGFNGDSCDSSADCRQGLECRGASRGLLGGLLAGAPYGPPGITDQAPFAPSSGTCRYRNDGCANEGQSCQRNDDCCNGENLYCGNNHCRRRN